MNIRVTNSPPALQGVKVSFQSSTANAWGASFLRHLNAELDQASRDDPQLMERVCRSAQALFNARLPTLTDAPSRTVLGMCALILSAYRELVVVHGGTAKAFEVIERGFAQTYRAFIQNICKPLLQGENHSPQALSRMNFRTWGEGMGKGGGAKGQGAHALGLDSDSSGYHHFFLAQGEPGLAPIIHAADQAWIAAVAAYSQHQLTELRRVRASDTGFCPFHFAPNARKRIERRPDVILELQINIPSAQLEADRRRSPYAADRRRALRARDDEHTWSLRRPVDRRARAQA